MLRFFFFKFISAARCSHGRHILFSTVGNNGFVTPKHWQHCNPEFVVLFSCRLAQVGEGLWVWVWVWVCVCVGLDVYVGVGCMSVSFCLSLHMCMHGRTHILTQFALFWCHSFVSLFLLGEKFSKQYVFFFWVRHGSPWPEKNVAVDCFEAHRNPWLG